MWVVIGRAKLNDNTGGLSSQYLEKQWFSNILIMMIPKYDDPLSEGSSSIDL